MSLFHVISHVFYKIFHVKSVYVHVLIIYRRKKHWDNCTFVSLLKSLLGFTSNLSNDHLFALWQKCLLHIWKKRNMIRLLYLFLFVQYFIWNSCKKSSFASLQNIIWQGFFSNIVKKIVIHYPFQIIVQVLFTKSDSIQHNICISFHEQYFNNQFIWLNKGEWIKFHLKMTFY